MRTSGEKVCMSNEAQYVFNRFYMKIVRAVICIYLMPIEETETRVSIDIN